MYTIYADNSNTTNNNNNNNDDHGNNATSDHNLDLSLGGNSAPNKQSNREHGFRPLVRLNLFCSSLEVIKFCN